MENKKTKYVLSGTEEEVVLGDTITTVFSKNLQNGGKITRDIEFNLTAYTLPWALSLGIIEAVDEGEKALDVFEDELEDMVKDHELMIDNILNTQKETHKEISQLKKLILDINKNVKELKKMFSISTNGNKDNKCTTQTV